MCDLDRLRVAETLVQYGIERLLQGHFRTSKWALDCALFLRPEISSTLWQRGLACYYAGSYEEAASQFEEDMKLNGNDVEELIWYFLCHCKIQSFEAASAAGLLHLSHFSNVIPPMAEVLQLFQQKMCVADVLLGSVDKDGIPLKSYNATNALAYAHFYVGLYLEARGDLKEAETHLNTAAALQNPDFMGKLMAVHYQHFTQSKLRHGIARFQLGRSGHSYACSRIIQGGWQLSEGHLLCGNGSRLQVEFVEDLLCAASQGITAFDCGDIYTGVEQLYGTFLTACRQAGMDPKDIAIHTKLVPDLEVIRQGRVDEAYVRAVVRRSMNRLGVSCLHLVQLHWWDTASPGYLEAARALVRLQEEGVVKEIGLTNFDTRHVEMILDVNVPIASVQVQYSLLDNRPVASQLVALCEKHGIKILAYGVLAGGFLTDAWLGKEQPAAEVLSNRSLVKYLPMIEEFGGWGLFQELLRSLRKIADRHASVTTLDGSLLNVTIAMVAMQYILSQGQVGAIIIGSHGSRYLKETAASVFLKLNQQDLAEIGSVLAKVRFPTGPVYGLERDMVSPHGRIMKYNLNQVNRGQHLEELCKRYLELHFSVHPTEATRAGYRPPSTCNYRKWARQQCRVCGPGDFSIDMFPFHAAQSCTFDHFLSQAGSDVIKRHCGKVTSMLAEARDIDEESLSPEQQIDLQIIISQLHLQLVTFEKLKPQVTDPSYYLPFESLNYLLPTWGSRTAEGRDSVPCCHLGVADMSVSERLIAVLQRLRAMTCLIREAQAVLTSPPAIFVETALKTCPPFQHFLANDLPSLCHTLAAMDEATPTSDYDVILGDLKVASDAAWACVGIFATFLSCNVLPQCPVKTYGCGEEVYAEVLKYWHFIDSPEDLLHLGEEHFHQVKEQLEALAKEIDPERTWKEITKEIMASGHPESLKLLDSYMLEIERARAHMIRKELVSPLPSNEKVIGLYTPTCLVPFTPFGDFINPPPFAGMGLGTNDGAQARVGVLMLHSVAAMGLSPEEERRLLQSHDYMWISVIAPHETYPGHHVQMVVAQAHPRILRRFYESPLFYEGWGLYTEELAYETGFFDHQLELGGGRVIRGSAYAKLARLTQLRLRLWRAARVILDVKLNTGRLSFEQCQEFLISEVMFNPISSVGEVLMYASRPGYAPCYVAGFTSVMKLRAECEKKEGNRFSLRCFHDNLLSRGCVPFKLLECVLKS